MIREHKGRAGQMKQTRGTGFRFTWLRPDGATATCARQFTSHTDPLLLLASAATARSRPTAPQQKLRQLDRLDATS